MQNMDKHKLPVPSTLLTTSAHSKLSGSATGNPRNKCALKPGHSLMDWIRLGNSGVDLSGTGGRLMSVSKEELAKHNKDNDAWMAISGVVYNVSQYMEYHPGGTDELMRGVGTDATKLFNETHAWVNYSQLLNKCRIGHLVDKVENDFELEKSFRQPENNRFAKASKNSLESDVLPRFDWIQKRENIILFFYTKQYCNPGLLIRKLVREDLRLEIWILIGLYVHKFDFQLQDNFNWPPKYVYISSESGKVEVNLKKRDEYLWNKLGIYKMSKMLTSALDLEVPLEFRLFFKYKFNNDSFVMSLKNENIIYCLPVGYHLSIVEFVNGQQINRCYTPVSKSFINKYVYNELDLENLNFLIKFYPSVNSFSTFLSNLKENSNVKVSLPKGNLKLSNLSAHKYFCFIAAGSGLTPFLSLLDHLLNRNNNRVNVIKLLYFNKTADDIWCHEELQTFSKQDSRFEFLNVLSKADKAWPGLKGTVNSDLLIPIVKQSKEDIPFVAACGPMGFVKSVKEILSEVNFPQENLFIF